MAYFLTSLLTSSITMSIIAVVYIAIEPILAKKYVSNTIYYGWLIIIMGLIIPFRPHFRTALIQIPTSIVYYSDTSTTINQMKYTTNITPDSTGAITNLFELQWFHITFFIWLVGFIIFMLHYIVKHIRFMKIINKWSEDVTSTKISCLLDDIKSNLNIKHPIKLKKCPCISTPMLVGLIKPTILLTTDKLSDSEIALVLRHELIHYKRKDLLYRAFLLMALAIHWFNPMVYLITIINNRQCEISCDEIVTASLDLDSRKLYAKTVINISRKQVSTQTALSTNFYGGTKNMKKRIISIMTTKEKKLGFTVLCFIMLATISTGEALATNYDKHNITQNSTSSSEQTPKNNAQMRNEKIKNETMVYATYGLIYDEENDVFLYHGTTVKYFVDQLDQRNSYYYIIRPEGKLSLKALRNDENELIGIAIDNNESREMISGNILGDPHKQVEAPESKSVSSTDTPIDNHRPSRQNIVDEKYAIYEKYGLTYDQDEDMFYYQGKAVRTFLDEHTKDKFLIVTRPKGNIDIKALRNKENKLVGLTYMNEDEYARLFNPTSTHRSKPNRR